jgi:hypothetical protein
MSVFLMAQAGFMAGSNFLTGSDERANQKDFQWLTFGQGVQFAPWLSNHLWPRSGFMGGDPTVPMSLFGSDPGNSEALYDWPEGNGGQQQLKLRGITRDSSGAPLGSCVVHGFLTTGDVAVGKVTSDSGGYFELPTPYIAQNHYLVAYKPGGTDVTGSTVNTLQPS